jgi:DNA polymerase-3 subunit delta
LREALQTFPFFGTGKVIWFQNCTFLGEERTASTQVVTENLVALVQELKELSWESIRLVISAGKVDKRKVFYKTIEKIGSVQTFAGWSADDRDWAATAEEVVREQLRQRHKEASSEARAQLVASVGPNARQLHMETEKIALYVGDRPRIEVEDVEAVAVRNKQSRAFALGDAFGERNLQKFLRVLDEELWETQRDSQKSEIGLLYGIISKVRVLIFLKEMLREQWIKPDADYTRFKAQLERIPVAALPEDRRFNPLAMNPYVLFKALGQTKHYSTEELIQAMDLLLDCNHKLVFSGREEALVLQHTFIKIISRTQKAR